MFSRSSNRLLLLLRTAASNRPKTLDGSGSNELMLSVLKSISQSCKLFSSKSDKKPAATATPSSTTSAASTVTTASSAAGTPCYLIRSDTILLIHLN